MVARMLKKIYRYFELCNYNISNPHRDSDAPALIQKFDDVQNYLDEHQAIIKQRDAMQIVHKWSDDKVINYWQGIDPKVRVALKANDGKGIDKKYLAYLKARLHSMAEENPEKFLEKQVNNTVDSGDIEGVIQAAKKRGFIKLDMKVGLFTYADGSPLFKWKKGFAVKPYELLADYFKKDDDGRRVFDNLKAEVIGR